MHQLAMRPLAKHKMAKHKMAMHQLALALVLAAATGATALQAQSSGRPNSGVGPSSQQPTAQQPVQGGAAGQTPGSGTAPVKGGLGKAGTGHFGFRLGYYDNGDSGDGNPFLDETLTVIEPVLFYDYNVSDSTNIFLKFSYDNVSSASIERLSSYPSTQQSGATGDYYFGLDGGATWALDEDTRVSAFAHASAEYDYRSFGLGGSYAKDYDGDSTTLKFSGSAYFDTLDIIRFDGDASEGSDNRTALNLAGNWYQVMTPRMHAEMGVNLTLQSGFLETPYNGVVAENGSFTPEQYLASTSLQTDRSPTGVTGFEELPSSRARLGLHGRVRRMYGESTALELGGRLYGDDWGVTSFTLEPAAYFWLAPNTVRARVGYRFYTQTAADDYQARFTGANAAALPEFRTQDADLGDFSSHTLGFRLDWFTASASRWDLTFDYTTRDDGLDYMFGSIGWSTSF